MEYGYDSLNNLSTLTETINGAKYVTDYAYDGENRVKTVTVNGVTRTYTYDTYGRITQMEDKQGETSLQTIAYTYGDTAERASTQIATMRTTRGSAVDVAYSYTYDDNGNILSVSDGTNTTSYVYDSANQLIRENNLGAGKTWTWVYDNAGNILTKNEYAYTIGELGTPIDTIPYTYGDASWGDLLTAYDGIDRTSDEMGNLLTDGTWSYTWQNGRELAAMTDGTITWSYTYDANGMRTQRTDGTTVYNYVYNGGSLSQMTVGSNTLNFAYDASGRPMMVTYNGTNYYYITNLQGDVVGIADSTGTLVVSYTYDAWGKPLSLTGSMADTLGVQNPLRYRGYVYDQETGLYYLQSRYYDPEIGRFINADGFIATGQGFIGNNMFAYCRNNPVKRKDATGTADISYNAGDDTPWDDLIPQNLGRGGGSGGGTWGSFMRTLQSAADGLSMAVGQRDLTHVEEHHLITNKHSTKPVECKEIIDQYNYSLDHESNIVPLQGHRGRHTNAYHEFIAIAITELDVIAAGNTNAFIQGMEMLGKFIQENWWLPYAKHK